LETKHGAWLLDPGRTHEGFNSPHHIASIWQRQVADPAGFEALYVATLRSAGIPARLNAQRHAEFSADGKWQPAPRSPLEKW